MKYTLGELYRQCQLEIPNLTEIREVLNAGNNVIDFLSLTFPGVIKTETAITRVVADTSEDITINAATWTVTTTTDQSATIKPGDIIVLWDTNHNNGSYIVSCITTTVINITHDPRNLLNTEGSPTAISGSYAVFRVANKVIMPKRRFDDVSFAGGSGLLTDATLTYDLGLFGIEQYDVLVVDGTAVPADDKAVTITSFDRSAGTITAIESFTVSANDTPVMEVIRPSIGYTYDAENSILGLADWVKDFQQIYLNDELLSHRQYELVKDSTDEEYINMSGRDTIQLPASLFASAADVIKLKIAVDLPRFLYAMNSAYINIPSQVKNAIFSGTMQHLLRKPKYREDLLLKEYSDQFNISTGRVSKLEDNREPASDEGREYTY